jgi:hypothetical protein
MPTSPNPYLPPTVRDVPTDTPRATTDAVYFMQLAVCSFAGFAVAVLYTEAFAVTWTQRVLLNLTVGSGFWIGWGIIIVSSFVTHLVLQSNAQTIRWFPRLTACPVGFFVALMAKYLIAGKL